MTYLTLAEYERRLAATNHLINKEAEMPLTTETVRDAAATLVDREADKLVFKSMGRANAGFTKVHAKSEIWNSTDGRALTAVYRQYGDLPVAKALSTVAKSDESPDIRRGFAVLRNGFGS